MRIRFLVLRKRQGGILSDVFEFCSVLRSESDSFVLRSSVFDFENEDEDDISIEIEQENRATDSTMLLFVPYHQLTMDSAKKMTDEGAKDSDITRIVQDKSDSSV
jgi:hypothetical protein